jgi:hypothetical protein
MRVIYHNHFALFSCCIFFAMGSCTKRNEAIHTGTNIYIAGDNGNNPVLWTNGHATILSANSGSASQVIASGTDVYVAGEEVSKSSLLTPAGPYGQAVYWKNDIEHNVGIPSFMETSVSIAAAGSNFYVASFDSIEVGTQAPLNGLGTGSINAIFALGPDFYAAGSDSVGDAVYWKNGVLNVVQKGYYPTYSSGSDPSVASLYVSGNDVYIGGFNINDQTVYWKNGVPTLVQARAGSNVSQVRSIFVEGNDVYLIGNYYGPSTGGYLAPAYWKNGVEVDLRMNGAVTGQANAIFVSGSDVYVAGQVGHSAAYWKNGVETILTPNGSANSIFVQ